MSRIKNFFKISWRLSIEYISYSTFSNEFEVSDVEAPTKNPEGNPAVKELLNRHAEQLKEMRIHIEKIQSIHENEFNTTIKKANARINELTASLFDKNELIVFRDEKIQRLKKKLVNRFHIFVESEDENKTFEHNFESKASDRLETRKIKTIILSNSDEFTEKNNSRIDDWALKIQNKLKKNAHLFSIEDVKIGYVQNLIGGQTLRRLEPRFRENAKNPYKTVNEIVDDFQRIYNNFNCRLIAVNSFRDLQMRGNNFIDFWAEFQKLFDDLEYSDDHLLEEFIHKMSFALQKHLSMKCDKAIDLYDLASLIKKTTERWRTAKNIENKAIRYKVVMNKSNVSKGTAVEAKTRSEFRSVSILASKTASSASVPRATPSATVWSLTPALARTTRSPNPDSVKEKSIIEGRCFNCNEIDHIAKEYTKPKMMKMNEIKEISDEKNSEKE